MNCLNNTDDCLLYCILHVQILHIIQDIISRVYCSTFPKLRSLRINLHVMEYKSQPKKWTIDKCFENFICLYLLGNLDYWDGLK